LHVVDEMISELLVENLFVHEHDEIQDVVLLGKLVYEIPAFPSLVVFRVSGDSAIQNGNAVQFEKSRLPDDLVENDGGDKFIRENVPNDVAGPHGRKLVMVSDENEIRLRKINRLEQPVAERNIKHGDLVDNDDVAVERGLLVPREFMAVVFQKPMHRLRWHVDNLFDPLRRLARGRRERDPIASVGVKTRDPADHIAFADTRATGDENRLVSRRREISPALAGVQLFGD